MAIGTGSRVGPYEVIALIAEGGMGKVWRARHTALKRDDALKVLPDAFAANPDRLARLQREAQVLASLNHPNIAHIHGLEEGDGTKALVMELVEGPTLADRIIDGAIPVDESISLARQIAEALEAAHAQGIIHRDLKPANIKLRPDGIVKVLDFGLAKALDSAPIAPDSSLSPTMSGTFASQVGIIVGTAAYMSPEQARGRSVDKRSDIWAFGCVLYEMLTGAQVFARDTVTDTLAAIIERDPDWSALPRELPSSVRALLKRCLERDSRKRIADMSTALFALDEATAVPGTNGVAAPAARTTDAPRRGGFVIYAAVAVVAMVATLASVWALGLVTPLPTPGVVRFSVTGFDAAAAPSIGGVDRDIALTPDGTRLVYVGNNWTELFVRHFDRLEPISLATGTPRNIFVSPDGQSVGFADGNTPLKRVPITGGPAVVIAPLGNPPRGAAWLPDDTIVFATSATETGLLRVSANGGEVTTLTRPDRQRGEIDHLWPEALPDGRGVLFTITPAGGLGAASIAVLDLTTGQQKIVLRGGHHAHYTATGHLVYAAGGSLRAVAFDLSRLETRGTPVPVLPQLVITPTGGADFTVASTGTLAYVDARGTPQSMRTLVWVDRDGREEAVGVPPRSYTYPRVSPDGKQIAVSANDEEQDIWLWDSSRRTLTRFTFEAGQDNYPVWVPDGRRIIFSGDDRTIVRAADGTGLVEVLVDQTSGSVTGLSADGTQIVLTESSSATGRDVMLFTPSARTMRPLLQTPFNEANGVISRDGRWLAYESNNSGRNEIYVRPFPDVATGQWQVSVGGGTRPLWAPSGKELFYIRTDTALMRVPVEATETAWNAGTPSQVFERTYYAAGSTPGRTYDISPDGQRFLMLKEGSGSDAPAVPPSIVVVESWHEELKRLLPR